MAKRELPLNPALYPVPVVIVSCMDRPMRRANAMTAAWCGVVSSNPPFVYVSVRPSRHTHKLLLAEREFVINIPSKDILREVDQCGILSGMDVDKFKQCKFTPAKASKVSCPMITECPVNIECKVKDILRYGSHDMFVAEIVARHVNEALISGSGNMDYAGAAPIVYNQGEYWSLGSRIGNHGFSSK